MGIIGIMAAYPLATLSVVLVIVLIGFNLYIVERKEQQKERIAGRTKYPYTQYLDDKMSGRDTSWFTM